MREEKYGVWYELFERIFLGVVFILELTQKIVLKWGIVVQIYWLFFYLRRIRATQSMGDDMNCLKRYFYGLYLFWNKLKNCIKMVFYYLYWIVIS